MSSPMFFIAIVCMVSDHGLGLLHPELRGRTVHTSAEVTLIIVLFTDASRIDISLLRRERALPLRLLGIGLPLTVVLGAVAAYWLFAGSIAWTESA